MHLHLKKLAGRSNLCTATLSSTHPLRSFLGPDHCGGAPRHDASIRNFTPAMWDKVKGALVDVGSAVPPTMERFESTHDEARPGFRLVDVASGQIDFDFAETKDDPDENPRPQPHPDLDLMYDEEYRRMEGIITTTRNRWAQGLQGFGPHSEPRPSTPDWYTDYI